MDNIVKLKWISTRGNTKTLIITNKLIMGEQYVRKCGASLLQVTRISVRKKVFYRHVKLQMLVMRKINKQLYINRVLLITIHVFNHIKRLMVIELNVIKVSQYIPIDIYDLSKTHQTKISSLKKNIRCETVFSIGMNILRVCMMDYWRNVK